MTTLSLTRPLRRPAPARRAAFGQIVLNEARLTWRRPVGLIGGLGLPTLLLVVFGELPSFHQTTASLGGLTVFDLYVPILIVFSLAMLVPPSWLLAAQGLVQFCVALAGVLIVLVAGVAAFGATVPKSPGGLGLSLVLSIAGLFPVGLLIAAMARTANGASVIGRLAFFPMIFFAGLWLPRAMMPGALLTISNYTPLGAAVEAIQDSMQTGFPPAAPLLVLLAYAVLFGYLARRFFRWE